MLKGKRECFALTRMGRVLLDLVPAPPQPPETKDFKVLPDLSILAGLDLSPKTLALLFRYCKVTRIDRVIEFRLDKATMKAMPSPISPNKEILSVLKPCAPLPGSVVDFLEDQIKRGGVVSFRTCRGLVKAEMPEILAQIRAQPRLKGYLDRGGPPDRKSTRLNSSHVRISYAGFCLKKTKQRKTTCRTSGRRQPERSRGERRRASSTTRPNRN